MWGKTRQILITDNIHNVHVKVPRVKSYIRHLQVTWSSMFNRHHSCPGMLHEMRWKSYYFVVQCMNPVSEWYSSSAWAHELTIDNNKAWPITRHSSSLWGLWGTTGPFVVGKTGWNDSTTSPMAAFQPALATGFTLKPVICYTLFHIPFHITRQFLYKVVKYKAI